MVVRLHQPAVLHPGNQSLRCRDDAALGGLDPRDLVARHRGDQPRVGPRGRTRRSPSPVLARAGLPGSGVHGDGDRPHAPAAPRRPAGPRRDGRGVDARVHHRGPARRASRGPPRGGGNTARDDPRAGAGAPRRRDGRRAPRVPAVVRAGRHRPARVGGLRPLGRASSGWPGPPRARSDAGAMARSGHAGRPRPGRLQPAVLLDGRAASGVARPGRGARARGGSRRPPRLRLRRGRRPGGAR